MILYEFLSFWGWLRRAFGTRWSFDLAAALFLFALGSLLAYLVTTGANSLFFYQNLTPEIVYAACGYGYRHPGELSGPIIDFVLLRSQTLDCTTLEGVELLKEPTLFATLQMYLGRTIAFFWQGPTLTYAELWPLTALVYGAYTAGCYALLRLFYPIVFALSGGFVLALSPLALSMLFSFRDFSKAPFAIWGIVLLISAMRANGFMHGISWALATGLIMGIGAGFRIDLLVMFAVMIVTLLAVWGLRSFFSRMLQAAAMTIVFVIVVQPVFDIPNTGGNGAVISQGLSEPFRRFLGLEPASYDLGHAYLDELALSSVAAMERPRTPNWDAHESRDYQDVSQAMKVSLPHVLEWLPLFAADFATQAIKSAGWITAMPSLVSVERGALDPSGPLSAELGPSQWMKWFYNLVGQPWLIAITVPGLMLFYWREAALRPSEVIGTVLLLAGLVTMPVAQLSVRHVFHLEFIWLFGILGWVAAWFDRNRLLHVKPRFVWGALASAVFVIASYVALIAWQNTALPHAFANLLALPREPAAQLQRFTSEIGTPAGRFKVVVPADHADIISAEADSMTDKMPLRGLPWDVRAEADRLLLSLKGCPAGNYQIHASYTKREGIWQPLDYATHTKIGSDAEGVTQVLLPAFYRPTQNLDIITVTPLADGCDAQLDRVQGATRLPPHIIVRFKPNWRETWQRRGFGHFGKPPA